MSFFTNRLLTLSGGLLCFLAGMILGKIDHTFYFADIPLKPSILFVCFLLVTGVLFTQVKIKPLNTSKE